MFGRDEDRAVLVESRARIYWGESEEERAAIEAFERAGVDSREAAYRVCSLGERTNGGE